MNKTCFVVVLFLLVLTGCNDELYADKDLILLGNEAVSVSFTIKSNIAWTIDVDANWLNADPLTGSNDALITLTCTENKNYTPREAVVTIKGGDSKSITLHVIQDAASGIQISWEEKTDMPTERSFVSPNACIIDGKIFIIGGAGNGEPLDAVEAYDPGTDSWESKAPLLKPRWGHTANVVNSKIYVMGGSHSAEGKASNEIEVYDPVANSWTLMGTMPTERIAFGSCVVNEKIYVMGGRLADPGGEYLNSLEVYDPSTENWTTLSPLPTAKIYFSATATDQTIFAIGGILKDGAGTPTASIYKYDIADDSWTEGLNLNQGRWGIVSCLADSLIVCAGGYTGPTGSPKATVEIIYTGSEEILLTSEMNNLTSLSSICQYNGKIYVFGGANVSVPVYGASGHVEEGTFVLP